MEMPLTYGVFAHEVTGVRTAPKALRAQGGRRSVTCSWILTRKLWAAVLLYHHLAL